MLSVSQHACEIFTPSWFPCHYLTMPQITRSVNGEDHPLWVQHKDRCPGSITYIKCLSLLRPQYPHQKKMKGGTKKPLSGPHPHPTILGISEAGQYVTGIHQCETYRVISGLLAVQRVHATEIYQSHVNQLNFQRKRDRGFRQGKQMSGTLKMPPVPSSHTAKG